MTSTALLHENACVVADAGSVWHGAKVALCMDGQGGEAISYRDLALRSARFADHLSAAGIRAGDRIAIFSEPRPRWSIAFFAALRIGAVAVPLDTRLALAELLAILRDAEPRVLLVSAATAGLGSSAAAELTETPLVYSLEPRMDAGALRSIDDVTAIGESHPAPAGTCDAAVLTYTSGTTSAPKGVVTTHANLLAQVADFRTVFRHGADDVGVSILPLSHLFELTAGFLAMLDAGARVCYVPSLLPDVILEAMREQRATLMITVPLFLQVLRNGVRRHLAQRSWAARATFAALYQMAGVLPLALRRVFFTRLRRSLGSSLKYFVCGGAPLDRDLIDFFARIGLPVYQGYGMAEASPVIATNCPAHDRPGSVGKPLPSVEVRIDGDGRAPGEILTRGPHVMRGYFRNEAQTCEAIDSSGWLRTGDLGELDADGYLWIRGRSKSLIVLGNGKKVQPEELEPRIFDHPDIAEGCVVAARSATRIAPGMEEVCAVVVPATHLLERLENDRGAVDAHVRALIHERCRSFAAWKHPTRIVVSREQLPRTATRKVARREVERRLAAMGERS